MFFQKKKANSQLATCPSSTINVNETNLSFAGCGFNGIYYVGVASCFREYCPKVSYNKISGASAGAIAACALACHIPLGDSTSDILKIAIEARSRALGPFSPTFDVNKIVSDALTKALPEDCHKRVNGRLHISVTRVSDGKNVILSQFDSKEDLIQAVLCSCFIPLWSGIIPPKFHGVSYMDGGLSNNLLVLDEQTVTISPFAGESDICPQDDFGAYMQLTIANTSIAVTPANMYRIQSILFPPHPEVMSKMCQQGFDDALRFLQRNNIISCLRCVAIQSSFSVTESEDCKALSDSGYEHEYDGCRDCEERRELAVLDPLPDPVAQAIQEAIDQVNNGLMNWLFKHKPVKILSFLTIPWVLPFDIAIVIIVKLHRQLPWIKNELKSSLHNLLSFARSIVLQMDGSKKHLYSAQFDCKLAVTEYDYKTEHLPASHVLGSGGSCSPLINPSSNPQQTVIPDSGLAASRKASLVKRSQTFGGRKKSALSREPSRMGSLRHQQLQRKSYAGSEFVLNMQNRRVSMMAEDGMSSCAPPERVITSMNLGLTLDLSGSKSGKSSSLASLSSSHSNLLVDTQDMAINESCVHEPPDVIETLKNLSEDLSTPEREISAISLANRALHLERVNSIDHLDHHDDGFERILAAAKDQEALMTYYYMDEKNQVKITQIFNLPTEQNAEVISCDELQSKW